MSLPSHSGLYWHKHGVQQCAHNPTSTCNNSNLFPIQPPHTYVCTYNCCSSEVWGHSGWHELPCAGWRILWAVSPVLLLKVGKVYAGLAWVPRCLIQGTALTGLQRTLRWRWWRRMRVRSNGAGQGSHQTSQVRGCKSVQLYSGRVLLSNCSNL